MPLQLNETYAKEIAIRATAHSVRSSAFSIEKELTAIGTNHAFAFANQYLVKLRKLADEIEANAETLSASDYEDTYFVLNKNKLELQLVLNDFGQRISKEIKKLSKSNKYDNLKLKVIQLYDIDLFEINVHHANRKKEKVAEELMTVSTLNQAAVIVRVHEAEKAAIQQVWKALVDTTFIREMLSRRPKNEKEFAERFDDYSQNVVKQTISGTIKPLFKKALTTDGQNPDEDTIHFLGLGKRGKLDQLIDEFFDPSAKGTTVGAKLRKELLAYAYDVFSEQK